MAVMGIDIGGSGIKGAPVDIETGAFLQNRIRIPTPEPSKPDEVARAIKELIKQFNWQGPVGCGFPSVVRQGKVYTAANIDSSWIGVNAAALFKKETGCPMVVLNDADVAGMAEMKFGAGRDCLHGVVIMLTLGTGIGSAIFTDGHLVPNTEFGHMTIRDKDAEKRASDAARQNKNLSWEKWSEKLNEYLAEIEKLFWPDLIIIGGGVSKEHQKFFPFLRTQAKIVPAKLLNNAGIVGAALAGAQLL